MARCPHCDAEAPAWTGYCPTCGRAQYRRNPSPEQPPLPFSPFGTPPMALQPAGAGAAPGAEPIVGPPLSTRQVAITVVAILLFLLAVVLLGQGWLSRSRTQPAQTATGNLPVLGAKGELVEVGRTGWGVAFTEPMERFNNQAPQHGQFFAVGVVVANRGKRDILLSDESLALLDNGNGEHYTPIFTAWGTPEDFDAGRYRERAPMPPRESLAGIIVFDTPRLTAPRLLVRDLTADSTAYTGAIDLTRDSEPANNNQVTDRDQVWVVMRGND